METRHPHQVASEPPPGGPPPASAPAVSVIIPTYNERDNITTLVERLNSALARRPAEIVVVDDNSPDGTAAEVERMARQRPLLRCVVRHGERGLATAVIRGLQEARGDLCVVMDADLSHPPEKIPELLDAMADPSVQMAIGSRFVPGAAVDMHWPMHRRLNSLVARLMARPLTSVRDMMAGFFCVRRKGLRLSELRPIGYKIALELIVRHGWKKIVEVPITFTDRMAGKTKLSAAEQLRYLRHLARLYGVAWFGRRG